MTPLDLEVEGKHMANLRRKLPPNAEESWVGRAIRSLPSPIIPLAPLARLLRSQAFAQAKIKSEIETDEPAFTPSVDWRAIVSLETSPTSYPPLTVFSERT